METHRRQASWPNIMSDTPTLSWGELWSIYRRSPAHVQQEILAQLHLDELLEYASEKVTKEVLAEAPEELKPQAQSFNLIEAVYQKWGRKPPRR